MNFALAAPVWLALLAVASVAVWSCHRKHLNLLWFAAALLLAACAYCVSVTGYWGEANPVADAVSIGLLSGAAAVALSQSVAMRFGRRVHVLWSTVGAGLMATGIWWLTEGRSTQQASWLVALGLTVLLGHVLPVIWRLASRHHVERLLLAVYTAICAVVLLSPGWVQEVSASGWGMGMLVALAGGALAAAMVGCTLTDGILPGLCTQRGRDALTGLLSRRAFEFACGSHPAAQQISVMVLCDLDNFQRINNQFGPTVGNDVLRSFAQLLQASVREGDHVARMGGEEFGLALRDIDLDNARVLVQRITHAMRQQHWASRAAIGPLTASFGVAMVRENDLLPLVLHRADVLLCQAKDAGCNRVEVDETAITSDPLFV